MLSPIFFAMVPICIGLAPLQEATPWSIVQSQQLSGDRLCAADDSHQLNRLRPIRTSAVSPRCPEVRLWGVAGFSDICSDDEQPRSESETGIGGIGGQTGCSPVSL